MKWKLIIVFIFIFLPILGKGQIITTIDSIGCYDINGIAIDKYGNIYYTSPLGNQVKKFDTNLITSVIAGTGSSGYFGDNGPATNALLN
jgi:hypothetical protein